MRQLTPDMVFLKSTTNKFELKKILIQEKPQTTKNNLK